MDDDVARNKNCLGDGNSKRNRIPNNRRADTKNAVMKKYGSNEGTVRSIVIIVQRFKKSTRRKIVDILNFVKQNRTIHS